VLPLNIDSPSKTCILTLPVRSFERLNNHRQSRSRSLFGQNSLLNLCFSHVRLPKVRYKLGSLKASELRFVEMKVL